MKDFKDKKIEEFREEIVFKGVDEPMRNFYGRVEQFLIKALKQQEEYTIKSFYKIAQTEANKYMLGSSYLTIKTAVSEILFNTMEKLESLSEGGKK